MYSKMYFHPDPIWDQTETIPFTELILSWNGIRPRFGKWTFSIRLEKGDWVPFAEWGATSQKTLQKTQDTLVSERPCTSFQIKVEGDELEGLHRLCVCVSDPNLYQISPPPLLPTVHLENVSRQSQHLLPHPRCRDLCSPTSTSIALGFLAGKPIDPVAFANRVWDEGFDIYGNWILNVAEGYHQTHIPCHVERLPDFTALHTHLQRGKPVVVSVKGPLKGAPRPYEYGHLMCITGYENGRVHCIDPAFADSESTATSYELTDFLTAWGKRRGLAYVFS